MPPMTASGPDPAPHPRALAVEGLFNLRDVGGMHTVGGGVIRSGVLYRSEAPCSLVGPGLDAFAALGFASVVDLRDEDEQEGAPVCVPEPVRRLSVPISRVVAGGNEFDAILAGTRRSFSAADMGTMMINMFDGAAESLGAFCRLFADDANRPLLVHCTAGKDRTGAAVAVLLAAVGVRQEEILEDYAATTWMTLSPGDRFRDAAIAAGGDLASVETVLTAPADAMRAALDHLTAKYGSAAGYLSSVAGVPEAALARMRDALVEERA